MLAVVPQFLAKGAGAIINLTSVVALAPEFPMGIYAATKAFVLTFSQSLQAELGPRGLYRYLYDSRIVERAYPRLRARLAGGL